MAKMYKQSPIFVKTFDLLKWILTRTEKFPKNQRFFLAKRINDTIFDFYEVLVEAASLKDRMLVAHLKRADAHLFKLKHYMRLAMEMKFFSFKQYEHGVKQAEEVGRLLGGWLKASKK